MSDVLKCVGLVKRIYNMQDINGKISIYLKYASVKSIWNGEILEQTKIIYLVFLSKHFILIVFNSSVNISAFGVNCVADVLIYEPISAASL